MSKTQDCTAAPSTRDAILDELSDVAEAALIHEAMGKKGALSASIKPAYPVAKVCGFALTVQSLPGDNLMLHKALSIAKPGDVLVAAVEEFREAGLWGEIASVAAMQRGVRGLITDGAVRDVDAIQELGFPVFCGGLSIKGTTKRQKGAINEPIVIGNVLVHAGDIVIGDTDGVVRIPQAKIGETIESARGIKAREEDIMRQIREGKLTIDLLNLRDALRELDMDD